MSLKWIISRDDTNTVTQKKNVCLILVWGFSVNDYFCMFVVLSVQRGDKWDQPK